MIYLTSEIQKQFQNIVEEVDWLSDSTKDTARCEYFVKIPTKLIVSIT